MLQVARGSLGATASVPALLALGWIVGVVLALVGRSTSRIGLVAYGVMILGLMAFLTPALVYVALAATSGGRVLAAPLEIVALGVYGFLVGGITLSIISGLRSPHRS